jgi:monothiol glutaredoxin
MKPSCGWSKGVRAVLNKYQLPFVEKDIVNSPENYAEMVRKSGQTLQPTLDINGRLVADVSGEELENWLVAEGFVDRNAAPVDVPTNSCCSANDHA